MINENIFKRRCVSCREKFNKFDLIRIVKNKQGKIFYDETSKKEGRGAYLCKRPDCFKMAQSKKSINRALKSNIPQDIYDELSGKFFK